MLNSTIPVAKELIRAAMSVGGMCRVMTYNNPSLGIMAAYRANANWTAIHIIVLPTNRNLQTVSYDLSYAVANDTLYAYNPTTFQYEAKFAFLTFPGITYNIRNTGGRILVWQQIISSVTNLTSTFGYEMYGIQSVVKAFSFHHKFTGSG